MSVKAKENYRKEELKKVSNALLACESLLIVGENGSGKSFFCEELALTFYDSKYPYLIIPIETVRQITIKVCRKLNIDEETIEGKKKTIMMMQEDIIEHCKTNQIIFLVDDAHRQPPTIRIWLERLMNEANCPVLLLATTPPARDIFLKLPRIELKPLKDKYIRQIMQEKAEELELSLKPADYAKLQASAGGNPMLAERVVKEKYLGIENTGLDHTQWIDGTPILMAFLMCLVIIRFIGLGLNNTSLYLLGGIITTAIGVSRILIYSLPKKGSRLGK
ncbi:ATP-binding protein [Cyanobacterium aponinum]|uniref:ATP-binding protein n=1 Tax=Cyanobacterium aponinum TaxID=379064 RepID=UPI000C12BD8A|nr:ATP-binding protein [Cyanobacterium aponinum]PHV63715.1 9-O-acetyl-N-acetylneuraminate esterase [Cyanobacterium aponinum IPPAS B-1201]